MRRKLYKEGFERLGIVLFVCAGLAIAAVVALSRQPFDLDSLDAAERQAAEAKIAEDCNPDNLEALYDFCRERVLGPYRWRHYRDSEGAGAVGLTIAGGALVVVLLGGYPVFRWVRAGFRQS